MDEKTLKALVEAAAVKRVKISANGSTFFIEIDTASQTHIVNTRDGKPRLWRNLDACARWLRKIGLGTATLELTHWQALQRGLL